MYVHKRSKTRNSFTTSHWQAGVHPSPGKQGSITCMVTWEDKCHNSKRPLLSSSSPRFISWEWCHIVWNIPLASLGQPVPPHSLFCTSSLAGHEKLRSLWL